MCPKLWEPSECSKSSTWRELAAIDFSLESFAPVLERVHLSSGSLIARRRLESLKSEA